MNRVPDGGFGAERLERGRNRTLKNRVTSRERKRSDEVQRSLALAAGFEIVCKALRERPN